MANVIACGLCHTRADMYTKQRGSKTVVILSCPKCGDRMTVPVGSLGSFILLDETVAKVKPIKTKAGQVEMVAPVVRTRDMKFADVTPRQRASAVVFTS